MPSEQPPTRVDRCPTCGHDREVVTSDEGTSYFAPQQARVELAERISGWADDMEDSVPDQDDLRMIADLREAASTLTTYEQALGAVRTVLFDWVGKQERSMPRTRDEWGPVCAGCGADEYRIDGFCSGECRDRYQFGLEIRAALEGSKQ